MNTETKTHYTNAPTNAFWALEDMVAVNVAPGEQPVSIGDKIVISECYENKKHSLTGNEYICEIVDVKESALSKPLHQVNKVLFVIKEVVLKC